jgi:hypothetical protein
MERHLEVVRVIHHVRLIMYDDYEGRNVDKVADYIYGQRCNKGDHNSPCLRVLVILVNTILLYLKPKVCSSTHT